MGTLLLEPRELFPADLESSPADRGMGERTQPGRLGQSGGLTLDELITGVWEGLATRAVVRCPVCGGAMESRPADSDGGACRGECLDCGAGLG